MLIFNTMKRIYSRLSEDLDRKFSLACVNRGLNRPAGLKAAIESWTSNGITAATGKGTITPVIGSQLSDAILKLNDARQTIVNILDAVIQNITESSTHPPVSGDISRAVAGVPVVNPCTGTGGRRVSGRVPDRQVYPVLMAHTWFNLAAEMAALTCGPLESSRILAQYCGSVA